MLKNKIIELMELYVSKREEQLALMRKRHAHFTDIVKDYTSFDDFMRDWDEKMALWGVEASKGENCISLYIQMDYNQYEDYTVIMGKEGHLEIDTEVWWNELCTNTVTDIFTGENINR